MKKLFYLVLVFAMASIIVGVQFAGASNQAPDAATAPAQTQDPIPAAWPDEPGAMPVLIGGAKTDRPLVFSEAADNSVDPQAVAAPTLDIWYGENQPFGQNGNPQQWVNIMGNVTSPSGMNSLTYSLNGGPDKPLTIGPGSPRNMRLALRAVNSKVGDFNIEIDYADLNNGNNDVVITATDKANVVVQKTVKLSYSQGNVWPLPYDANWGSSSSVQDIAQVVDGNWTIQGGKLVPLEVGYDRLVAIGDETWGDYEVTVPFTVKALDQTGFEGASNGPGIGVLMRWQGHMAKDNEQPRLSWERTGALGWYRWAPDGTEGLELRGNDWYNGTSTSTTLEFNVPYVLKMSVQSAPGDPRGYYRLKLWKQSESEPFDWDRQGWSSETASQSGSVVLIAHHVETEFGNVQVRSLKDLQFSLKTDSDGNGFVTINPAGQEIFKYGERAIVTAFPNQGYYFSGWTGDVTSSSNPLVLFMTKDAEITANFVSGFALTTNVDPVGSGSIGVSPDKAGFAPGEQATLTASPNVGWKFKSWSGDASGSANPLQITMNSDKNITATFVEVESGYVFLPIVKRK